MMRIGVAKDIVTPAVKTPLGGYGSLYGQTFEGIHDDLYVKALLLDDGQCRVVLVTYDLIFHHVDLVRSLGQYIEQRHGIPADNVIVSYTHVHTGPALRGYDDDQATPEYEEFLFDRTRSCIDRAVVNSFEGTLEFGEVRGDWNMHRRRPTDKEPVNAPHPEGERDDTLAILRARDKEGNERALLTNFSCHPVAVGAIPLISAEFPGRLCQLLETEFYGTTALFFQGAGACSRPRIAQAGSRWKQCSFDEVDDMASSMARAVARAVGGGNLRPIEPRLAARRFVIPLDIDPLPKEHLRSIVAESDKYGKLYAGRAKAVLDRYDRTPDHIDLHAGIIRLDAGTYIAWLCGEVTYPVKQIVRQAFGDKKVIFIGYGDSIAYIPSDRYVREGGYEPHGSVVAFSMKGPFKAGIDDRIRSAFAAELSRIAV